MKLFRYLLATVIAMVFLTRARAQAPAHLPEDPDKKRESLSSFWEQALHPEERRYNQLMVKAEKVLERGGPDSETKAQTLLVRAVQHKPHAPHAHWQLATLCARRYRRKAATDAKAANPIANECKAHFLDVYEKSPTFDFDLIPSIARFAAAGGDYETAEDFIFRMLNRTGTLKPKWYQLLGQVYMALGRLEEAVSSFEKVLSLSSPYNAEANFALAVALERAGQEEASKDKLQRALKRDPVFRNLTANSKHFIPAADRDYYLALLHRTKENQASALFHLRRYIARATPGPWATWAKKKMSQRRSFRISETVKVTGTAILPVRLATKAVRKHEEDLIECVEDVPISLFEVHVSQSSKTTKSKNGARVSVLEHFNYSKDRLGKAVSCLEKVAQRIKLPRPKGGIGTKSRTEFMVVHP